MKMKKLGFLAIMLSLCLLIFSACGPSESMKNAYDDDSIVAGSKDSFFATTSTENIVGKNVVFTALKFTGFKTLKNVDVEENDSWVVNLTFTGKCKLVLVKDDEVFTLADELHVGVLKITVASGNYDLKIVGQDAEGVAATIVLP